MMGGLSLIGFFLQKKYVIDFYLDPFTLIPLNTPN